MDPIIIRSKNGIIISPYKKHQCRTIEYYTSNYDEVYHKFIEMAGFYVDNYQGIPAFISYKHPYDFLNANFPDYRILNMKEIKPLPMSKQYRLKKSIELREIQLDITSKILSTKAESDWFVHLQTGLGKTVLAAYLSLTLGMKTLITCFLTDVLEQWINTYHNKTTLPKERICFITSGKTLQTIIDRKFDNSKYDVYICTPGILTEFCSKTDYSFMYDVFNYLGIGLLIHDEAHRNMANITKINALVNVKHTLYLSADYGQGDSRKEKMWFNIVKNAVVIEPSIQDKIKSRNTKIMVIDYNTKPNSIEKESIYNRYGFSAQYYMEYEINRGLILEVLAFIVELIKKTDTEFRTLILLTQINHVDIVTDYLRDKFPQYSIGRYHSQMEPEERKNTIQNANIIISTYKSFGTGIDAKDIKYVIGTNQSNKIEDNQAAGRARPPKDGSSAMYFILVDRGFPYCSKKLKTRLNYLKDNKSNLNPFIYHYYQGCDLLK